MTFFGNVNQAKKCPQQVPLGFKTTDGHFVRLFDEHNALDQKIANMVARTEPGTPEKIEQLKKEKLALKDQIYVMLKKAAETQA